MMKKVTTAAAAALLAGAAWLPGQMALAEDKTVEVLHWWTSGGEAAALKLLKADLESKGIAWEDVPVAGGSGSNATTVLRSRVMAGDPPTAMQMLGLAVTDWARSGHLSDLDPLAAKEDWDKVVPDALYRYGKHDGHWVAAPVNIHRTNWVWANKKIFDELGLAVPETFDEFLAAAEKIKAAGYIPLAHGGQPWQEATIFDSVVLSVGGADFYRKALIELDREAIGSDLMKQVFDQMRAIRGLVDDDFSGRDWNLASAMVIRGDAAMQIMGDWAKGEFLNAGLTPDEDFLCFNYPGTEGGFTFNTDFFGMFQVGKERQAAQYALASAVMSKDFQKEFNLVKGSIPARTDVSPAPFDACGQKSMADLKSANASGTLLGSLGHGHAAEPAVQGAFYDVITAHFNSEMSSEQAVGDLLNAIELAQ